MTTETAGPGTITGSQLSRLLDLSPRRIQQLARKGVIPKADRDRYPLVGSIQGYIRWLTDDARHSEQDAVAVKLNSARLEAIEIRIAEKMRELIPVEDFRWSLGAVICTVFAELATAPDHLPEAVRPALQAEIERSVSVIEKAAAKALAQGATGTMEF